MAKLNPRDSFMTADAFLRVCATLDKAAKQGEFVTIGVMGTLEAFTLELHVKCLLLLEEDLHKRGHDLWTLFKFLSPKTRTELIQAFEEHVAKWPLFIAESKRKNLPTDLESLLIRGRHAFEEFRYGYENVRKSRMVWGLKGLIFVIRDRILEARPEWENALLGKYLKALNPHTAPIEKQR